MNKTINKLTSYFYLCIGIKCKCTLTYSIKYINEVAGIFVDKIFYE